MRFHLDDVNIKKGSSVRFEDTRLYEERDDVDLGKSTSVSFEVTHLYKMRDDVGIKKGTSVRRCPFYFISQSAYAYSASSAASTSSEKSAVV